MRKSHWHGRLPRGYAYESALLGLRAAMPSPGLSIIVLDIFHGDAMALSDFGAGVSASNGVGRANGTAISSEQSRTFLASDGRHEQEEQACQCEESR